MLRIAVIRHHAHDGRATHDSDVMVTWMMLGRAARGSRSSGSAAPDRWPGSARSARRGASLPSEVFSGQSEQMQLAAHGRAADLHAGLGGQSQTQPFQRRIRASTHQLAQGLALAVADAWRRASAMRRGLHRACLSCQAQHAVDRRPPDPEALGDLLIGLSVPGAGLDDADPEVIRDGCWHTHAKAHALPCASGLDGVPVAC